MRQNTNATIRPMSGVGHGGQPETWPREYEFNAPTLGFFRL
jgi:hypothetical protein